MLFEKIIKIIRIILLFNNKHYWNYYLIQMINTIILFFLKRLSNMLKSSVLKMTLLMCTFTKIFSIENLILKSNITDIGVSACFLL